MAKYLLSEQLKTNLSLGKTVEQWLGHQDGDGYVILKHIEIYKEKNGEYTLMYIENLDDGDENFLDVYEFSYVNADEPVVANSFDSVDELLHFAADNYRASLDKFVSQGMMQDEYSNYLQQRGSVG